MSELDMSVLVLMLLFGFTLVIKLRNLDFESHWNALIFFDKKDSVRFDYVLPNIVWFELSFAVWAEFWQ